MIEFTRRWVPSHIVQALISFFSGPEPHIWHPFETMRSVQMIDGNMSRDYTIMRRRVHGEWQYREMTEDEYLEHLKDWAI